MRGELYRRWLADERGLTVSEFVAERRQVLRQQRQQRAAARGWGPALQQMAASAPYHNFLQAGMQQGAPMPYGGALQGGIGQLLGGLLP